MPKTPIDYSNTVMYRIVCKDLNIIDCYIGSTTNFTERKYNHKYNCLREKGTDYHLPVYKFMRDNGGWFNWEVIWIENFPCSNDREKRQRERFWLEYYKATLNVDNPIGQTPEERRLSQNEWKRNYRKKLTFPDTPIP